MYGQMNNEFDIVRPASGRLRGLGVLSVVEGVGQMVVGREAWNSRNCRCAGGKVPSLPARRINARCYSRSLKLSCWEIIDVAAPRLTVPALPAYTLMHSLIVPA